MAKGEKDLDIYYAVGNTNTQRQESGMTAIINKRNSNVWKLISATTALVYTKKQFIKSLFVLGKEIA
tara:strand:+ start:402 stop:602 length:201 start_codon:yes stop_codon:yes gene_type:complete